MKRIRHKRPEAVLYIVMLIAGVSIASISVLCWWYFATIDRPSPPPVDTTRGQTQNTQPIFIQLGATRIAAIDEDYTKDSSLWRLVNKSHPLGDQNYEPAKLTKAPIAIRPNLREDEQSLRTILVPDLQAMAAQAATDGVTLTLGSGYRSPELQKYFFDNYAARDGVEAANKYSALPGQSEHQTGLSLDFAAGNMQCYLEQCFSDTPEGIWLAEHAHEYGFVLRYTKDGEATTGYQFEPWHFRYVGKDLAAALHDNNMLLEDVWSKILDTQKRAGVTQE